MIQEGTLAVIGTKVCQMNALVEYIFGFDELQALRLAHHDMLERQKEQSDSRISEFKYVEMLDLAYMYAIEGKDFKPTLIKFLLANERSLKELLELAGISVCCEVD